jgi:CheY-like chemotaxis protein
MVPDLRQTAGTTMHFSDFAPLLKNLQQHASLLLTEVGDEQAPEFKTDLQRLLNAVHELGEQLKVAPRRTAGSGDDPVQAERKLSHDLSNLLSGIQGTGEWLLEELTDRRLTRSLATLTALLEETSRLQDTVRPAKPAAEQPLKRPLKENLLEEWESQATLLVADDNEMSRSALRHKLEREGYRVETAEGGLAVLRRLAQIPNGEEPGIDLILLDLLMPDMNGDQVLQRLKGEPNWRDIPVIMISAWDDLASIVRCIEIGAEDYLVKPFEPALLRARIGSTLEKRWLRRREVEQAVQIQRSLMPPPAPPGAIIDGRNRAARYVSGDFFQHFRRPDGVIPFTLGDVAGKGFDAALLMAKIAGLFHYLSKSWNDCSALLATLNQEFYDRTHPGRFVTAVVGFYDPIKRLLTFANAGHVPPVLIGADGTVRQFPAQAPPLGVLPRLPLVAEEIALAPGSAFYIFSDGFIEICQADGQPLELEGFIPFLQRVQGLPVEQQLDRVFGDIAATGWSIRDDLTMLAIVPD